MPRDAAAMSSTVAAVVAITAPRIFDVRGDDFTAAVGRVRGLSFVGLALVGSDFVGQ